MRPSRVEDAARSCSGGVKIDKGRSLAYGTVFCNNISLSVAYQQNGGWSSLVTSKVVGAVRIHVIFLFAVVTSFLCIGFTNGL
jgi:hypothetical protein